MHLSPVLAHICDVDATYVVGACQRLCCRCKDLEGQRLQDSERLTTVNTELTRLKDTYLSKCQAVVSMYSMPPTADPGTDLLCRLIQPHVG